jgi:hypothetical protein
MCLMYDLPRRYSRGSRFVSRPKRIAVYLPLSTQMPGWLNLLKIDHNHCQILTSNSYCVTTIFVCPISFDASLSYLKIVCLFQFVYEDFIKGVKMPSALLTELISPHIFCFSSFKLAFLNVSVLCVCVLLFGYLLVFHLLYMDPILFLGSFLL